MKKHIEKFGLILVLAFFVSTLQADTPPPIWSEVITSSNGKYVLALISTKVDEQKKYVFQREKEFRREIEKEASIRKKFDRSGLYANKLTPNLLWEIDFYDPRSWVKVSDDAERVVIGKSAISPIFDEKPNLNNPSVKDVVRVHPNMEEFILSFYSFGKVIQSYKASDLIATEETLQNSSETYFFWSDEGVLNENAKTLSITKKNGEKLIFDLNGNILSGKFINQRNSESNKTDNMHLPQQGFPIKLENKTTNSYF